MTESTAKSKIVFTMRSTELKENEKILGAPKLEGALSGPTTVLILSSKYKDTSCAVLGPRENSQIEKSRLNFC
jgi:hypothetical protein